MQQLQTIFSAKASIAELILKINYLLQKREENDRKEWAYVPICRGYESVSGGFEKSATFAMLRPHLNVGAQKWTAAISRFTTQYYYSKEKDHITYSYLQQIHLFGLWTSGNPSTPDPKNQFLDRINIFRKSNPILWNQTPLQSDCW